MDQLVVVHRTDLAVWAGRGSASAERADGPDINLRRHVAGFPAALPLAPGELVTWIPRVRAR